MSDQLHPRLAAQLAKAPSYYNAVADKYAERIARGVADRDAMAAFFDVDVASDVLAILPAQPSRLERMLVRRLADVASI